MQRRRSQKYQSGRLHTSLVPINCPRRKSLIGSGGSRVSFGYVYVCSTSRVSGFTVRHQGVSGVSKERMFNHRYAIGQSRKRSKSVVGYLNSNSRISGVTVCHQGNKERMSSHVCPAGISGVSGVTVTSFGLPSPDMFFVGVEDCAVDVAVCGVLA